MDFIFLLPIVIGGVTWVLMFLGLLQAQSHAQDRQKHPENYVYRDVSTKNPALPQAAQKMASQLEQLGFHHMGTIQRGPSDNPHTEWVYIDQTATILTTIEPLAGKYVVAFGNVFADGFAFHTAHPNAANCKTENFEFNSLSSSLEDAYEYHLAKSTRYARARGAAATFRKMDSVVRWANWHSRRNNPALLELIQQQLRKTLFFDGLFTLLCFIPWILPYGGAFEVIKLATFGGVMIMLFFHEKWGRPQHTITVDKEWRKRKKHLARI